MKTKEQLQREFSYKAGPDGVAKDSIQTEILIDIRDTLVKIAENLKPKV